MSPYNARPAPYASLPPHPTPLPTYPVPLPPYPPVPLTPSPSQLVLVRGAGWLGPCSRPGLALRLSRWHHLRQVHVDHRPGTVLGNTRHPIGLCRLATSAALLSGDPLTRMALPELLDALEEGHEEGEDEGGVLDDVQPEAKSSPSETRPGPQRRKVAC